MATHGKAGTAIYRVWNDMCGRCMNPDHHAYKSYGMRGITVCEKWWTFAGFYEDMGDAPKGTTLERTKNELGYSKDNCEWATWKTQANNRRSCVPLTFQGKTLNVTQWAEKLNLNRFTLYDRLAAGWTTERTLTTPTKGRR